MKLKKLFKIQIAYAWIQFLLTFVYIGGLFLIYSSIDRVYTGMGWDISSSVVSDWTGYYWGIGVLAAAGILQLVIWILGIINACRIQAITKNSVVLIVFSVLTLFIGHLIVAYSQRNKHEDLFYVHKETKKEVKTEEVKKPVAKKAPAKKTTTVKKVAAKKPVAKKAAPKKVATKKTTVKKVAAKKPVAKKAVAKKVTTKKPVAKKAPAKKTSKR